MKFLMPIRLKISFPSILEFSFLYSMQYFQIPPIAPKFSFCLMLHCGDGIFCSFGPYYHGKKVLCMSLGIFLMFYFATLFYYWPFL
jgi:hypothetical protein